MTDPAGLSLVELLPLLQRRALSAVELLEACLARVARDEARLRAFVVLTPERARAAAQRADADRAAGRPVGPLAGVPVAVKDLYLTAGTPTTACSRVLAGHDPGTDSAVWERLAAAGAGLLGKTTTHEFAYGTGSSPTRNPWDPARTPGGSSGGSAAALAARMTPLATGTDTGGSLRIPAAACGGCAVRPAHGRVSCHGVLPLSPSMDTAGPMARRLLDVSLVLRLLAGHDPRDPHSLDAAVPDYPLAAPQDLRGVRVGVLQGAPWDQVDPACAAVVRDALAVLQASGAELVPIGGPPLTARMLSGPRTGYELVGAPEALHAHRDWIGPRAGLYGERVLARLRAGGQISAVDHLEAQRLRGQWAQQWRDLLAQHDLTAVAHATLDGPPPLLTGQAGQQGPGIALSVPWSLARWPALSVPAGLAHGLPVGLSLAAPPDREAALVGLGAVVDEGVRMWEHEPPAKGAP